jgi:hypothetical protein
MCPAPPEAAIRLTHSITSSVRARIEGGTERLGRFDIDNQLECRRVAQLADQPLDDLRIQ